MDSTNAGGPDRARHPDLPSAPAAAPAARPDEGGFSLVEVLAASVLLAAVMVAIMSMFIYGGQHVHAGKLMTTAVSISSDIHERFRQFSYQQTYLVIEDQGTPATDTHYCWDSQGATGDCAAYHEPSDSGYLAILNDWKSQVEAQLPQGSVTITVRGLRSLGTNPTEQAFASAKMIQVVSTIRWTEQHRARSVVFESLKV